MGVLIRRRRKIKEPAVSPQVKFFRPIAPKAKNMACFSPQVNTIFIAKKGFLCVSIVLDALFGAGFLFLHRALSFENSIETVAAFFCPRTKQGSNSS